MPEYKKEIDNVNNSTQISLFTCQ